MYVYVSILIAIIYLLISKRKSSTINKCETIYRILCIESVVFLIASIISDNYLYRKVLYTILFLEALFLLTNTTYIIIFAILTKYS